MKVQRSGRYAMAVGKESSNNTVPSSPGEVARPHVAGPGVVSVRFSIEEFATPPVRDALVLGRRSPVGCMALRKALAFLHTAPFVHIEVDDDTVADIVVRESIVRIVGREKLIALVLHRVKPLMTDLDILHLDIEAKLHLEAEV